MQFAHSAQRKSDWKILYSFIDKNKMFLVCLRYKKHVVFFDKLNRPATFSYLSLNIAIRDQRSLPPLWPSLPIHFPLTEEH